MNAIQVFMVAMVMLLVGLIGGIGMGTTMAKSRLITQQYVIVNDGCLELWKQKEGKHYEIGRLCPDSSASQVVYRFEIFPEYISLIEE